VQEEVAVLDCAVMVDKSSSGNPANSLIHDTANGCLISSFSKTQLLGLGRNGISLSARAAMFLV